jgi:hypothetical protein
VRAPPRPRKLLCAAYSTGESACQTNR